MNFRSVLSDSFTFTREAFFGNWIRGGIFLFLCLCQGILLSLYLQTGGLSRRTGPWWELTLLLIFISSILFGYCMRIFKGSATPPAFAPVGRLIKDGLLIQIALWIWWIPSLICIIFYASSHVSFFFWISICWLIVPLLVIPLIYFRYASTGKFVESIRFSNILSTIRTPGWGSYLAACGTGVVCFLCLASLSLVLRFVFIHILSGRIVPSLSAISAFFVPILYVFLSRFFTNVLMNRGVKDLLDTTEIHNETG
jgi:hypothetical protein